MKGEQPAAWFAQNIPAGWFTEAPEVDVDGDEIVVVGSLPAPDPAPAGESAAVAARARIQTFREQTREARVVLARQAERRFGIKVSWGARCGEEVVLFTTASVPVMTRLRQPERRVLDTLISAGVARSRSDALAWCVRLVGRHESGWIEELKSAIKQVDEVRRRGPD